MHPMITRRALVRGSMAAAVLALARFPLSAFGFAPLEEGEELVPFLDPQPIDPKAKAVHWDQLKDWITPGENVFEVSHYGKPTIDPAKFRLKVDGLVSKGREYTLDEIKARQKKEVTAILECGGNGMNARFMGAIGNVKFAGTPLAGVLNECASKPEGIEVVFWGADRKVEKIRNADYEQNFARSLSLEMAMREDILLCWEMNGAPLEQIHGFPLRLAVPGWYGVAWVKWLERIELRDRRYMGRFMARDYVTIRGEEEDGKVNWKESSVGPIQVKSIVARVSKKKDGTPRIMGAAWTDGTPLKAVQVKIDDGPWVEAKLVENANPVAWTFFTYDWNDPRQGEHTLVSRAMDAKGKVQPSADDPAIKLKKTYWEASQQYPRKVRI